MQCQLDYSCNINNYIHKKCFWMFFIYITLNITLKMLWEFILNVIVFCNSI